MKLSRWLIGILVILGFLLPFNTVSVTADNPQFSTNPHLGIIGSAAYVSGQIIVKFKEAASSAEQIKTLNATVGASILYTSQYTGSNVIRIPANNTVEAMVDYYRQQANVEYAEPNYYCYLCWTPNDPYYSYQWHFGKINLAGAWDLDTVAPLYGGDPSIVVAILDSGVAYENYGIYSQAPDLANTRFIQGYDFVNIDSHPNDDYGHGTHVCGTIAQSTNNGLGVAGIAFNSSIMPVKVFDGNGNGTATEFSDGVH